MICLTLDQALCMPRLSLYGPGFVGVGGPCNRLGHDPQYQGLNGGYDYHCA
jgi:hypothetical protein